MKLDNRLLLIVIVALTLALLPIAIFTDGPARVILSFFCLIFFPGYALLSALFTKQGDIGAIERIALSFGVSIAAVTVTGFVLNFTPAGIRLIPILISMGSFIVIAAGVGFIRQQALPDEMRLRILLEPGWAPWQGTTRTKKVIMLAGLAAALIAGATAIYFAVRLPEMEAHTEFYILNQDGKAENYPRQVKTGDKITVYAVIINHENKPTGYTVRALWGGNMVDHIATPVLAPGAQWKGKVNFYPVIAGPDQKIEFNLIKSGNPESPAGEPLYLYIDVVE